MMSDEENNTLVTEDVDIEDNQFNEHQFNEHQYNEDQFTEQFGGDDQKVTTIDVENDIEDCIDIGEQPDIKFTETVVEPSKRISKNKLTRYEFVRIIGERIQQLKKGAKPLIKVPKDSEAFSEEEIAIEELKHNMIPFKIRRPVKDHYEIWSIEELDKKHLESLFK